MTDQDPDRPIHIDQDDARAGSAPGVTRYVLAASLILVIVAFVAIYYIH